MLNASDILLCRFETWKYLTYFMASDLFSLFVENPSFLFSNRKKNEFKFSVAKLCSNSSCTLSASIGFIISKFKRRIRTNKNIVILSRGLTSWSSRSHCFQMHLALNLMQENMWKKDCFDYCRKKVNWFR